jgi:hypothetical protein
VQTENGDDMIYDGSNMPFIKSVAQDKSYFKVEWNSQAQEAVAALGYTEPDSVTDMDGCTSEGYFFNMAIITSVPGSPAAAWRDEFTLFFNITA